MTTLEIIAVVVSVLIVGAVITTSLINRAKGKNPCSGDCTRCNGCAHVKKEDEKE